MATANETVKKVLNHLMAKAESSLSAESGGQNAWFVKLSNGLIIQAGRFGDGNKAVSVTFPKAFTNADTIYVKSSKNLENNDASWASDTNPWDVTTTSFKVHSTGSNHMWFAIGY